MFSCKYIQLKPDKSGEILNLDGFESNVSTAGAIQPKIKTTSLHFCLDAVVSQEDRAL
jgi:hypothetical protein